jgi:DNA helicase II / ATP-dependent DNA helicase PcrA
MLEPDDDHDIQRQYADNILAITFTNKAAKEMRTRLSALIGSDYSNRCFIGTFHAFSAKCLRIYGCEGSVKRGGWGYLQTLDYSRLDGTFTIFDQNDCLKLVKELMNKADIDESKVKPNSVLSTINSLRGNMALPDSHGSNLEEMKVGGNLLEQAASRLLLDYVNTLYKQNAMDFEGLLINMYQMLQHSDIQEKISNKYRHILVDEMQDTNRIQYEIIKAICNDLHVTSQDSQGNNNDDINGNDKTNKHRRRSLFLVGDKNQAIYGWRGAKVDNVDSIYNDFKSVLSYTLRENYRCSPAISSVANALLGTTATVAMEKQPGKKGEMVRIIYTDDDETQAKCVATIINTLYQDPSSSSTNTKKRTAKQFAVLYRTNAQSRALEAEFVQQGIPYVLVGGRRFFDRKEVKDLLTMLKFVVNDRDDIALTRILSEVVKGVGEKTIQAFLDWPLKVGYEGHMIKCRALVDSSKGKTEDKLKGVEDIPLTTRQKALLLPFAQVMINCYKQTQTADTTTEDASVADLLKTLATSFLTPAYFQRISKNIDDIEERRNNINELLLVADNFDQKRNKMLRATASIQQGLHVTTILGNMVIKIGEFLEECALSSGSEEIDLEGVEEQKEMKDTVFLSTIHASKGLEFDACFVVGLEEGCLPITRSLEDKQRQYNHLKTGKSADNSHYEWDEDMANRRNFEAVFGAIDEDHAGNDDIDASVTSGQDKGAAIKGLLLNDSPAVQEERRLAFVAVTRAKEMLFLLHRKRSQIFTAKGSKWIDNVPSRFLEPLKKLEKEMVTSLKWK